MLSWWIDSLDFNKADNERSSTVVHDFKRHKIKEIDGINGQNAMLGSQLNF